MFVKNFTMKVCEIMHDVCEIIIKVCEKINLTILSKSIYFFKNNCYNIYIRLRKTTWKRKIKKLLKSGWLPLEKML